MTTTFSKFLLIIMIAAFIFSGCKNSKEEVEPDTARIEYDGGYYILNRGVIWDYAQHYTANHYSHSYMLPNADIIVPNYTIPEGDPPITLRFFLSTPNSTSLKEGSYAFIMEDFIFNSGMDYTNWHEEWFSAVEGKNVISEVQVGFDENGDGKIEYGEIHRLSGGKINYSRNHIEFDLTLTNGKKLRGRSAASYTKTYPPL